MTPFVALGLLLVALCLAFLWPRRRTITRRSQDGSSKENEKEEAFRYEPLHDFNWETTEPLYFRPFKPKYHLTMGIENLDPNELLMFDNTYKERLSIRHNLLTQHRDKIIGVTDASDPRVGAAVRELYHRLMGEYLPSRYPSIFQVQQQQQPQKAEKDSFSSSSPLIQNMVTGEKYPMRLSDSPSSTQEALEILPINIDEDFFILLPHTPTTHSSSPETGEDEEEEEEEEEVYILEAYSACFPSGFEAETKLGKRLAAIHDPIPGYKEKLEKSMDRFFRRLPAGKCVKRVNWAVTVDEELYSNFDKSGDALAQPATELGVEDLVLDKCFLRCERQTLHRLPHSRAIVFAFKTYLYPLEQVKAEGLGEQLATAIEGLKAGNNPGIYLYKNGPKWGEAVKEYLRR